MSNKKEIIERLNKNRQTKIKVIKASSENSTEVLARLQVAKKGSYTFLSHVAVISKIEGGIIQYYFVNYSGKLPINTFHNSKKYNTFSITEVYAKVVVGVIGNYNTYKHYHVNPYTFLVTGCLYSGLNLIEEGYLLL